MPESDEKTINALVNLLESGVGYQISLFGLLKIYQLEDLKFAVNHYEYDSESRKEKWVYEELFNDAREAVEFFEQKRREYLLGFDIEKVLNQEQ